MADSQQLIIRHSVRDVIQILENEPVKGDMIAEVTAVQVMNRVSIAHLSIERALKFLITQAGRELVATHDLKRQYQELRKCDSVSAEFLEEVFQAAVLHYRHNPNAASMTHLQTLERYLGEAGSDRAFQDVRYWELTQSLDEILLRRAYPWLHMELLHGLGELLQAPGRPMATVEDRVERAVRDAMCPVGDLAYSPETPKEQSVRPYMEWLRGFETTREALADAVQRGFDIGEDFMASLARKAQEALLGSADPAVRYFASTLDVLPRQPRDVVPCVEWLGPERERNGAVATPGGAPLGFIRRGLDGLWYITPHQSGLVQVSAKAGSQTDARCYLVGLLTRPARVTVEGEDRSLRIVGESHNFFHQNYDEINKRHEGKIDPKAWTHKVTFWDKNHGIKANESIRIEVRNGEIEGMVTVFEGTAIEVTGNEVPSIRRGYD